MDSNTAAIIIQTQYRSYLARKVYCRKLFEKFEKDECQRKEREKQQVSEGELLVNRYALQMEIDDFETITSNKDRHLNTMARRIQRRWRAYKAENSVDHPHQSTCQQTCSPPVIMNGLHSETSPDLTVGVVLDNRTLVSDRGQQIGVGRSFDYPTKSIMNILAGKCQLPRLSRDYEREESYSLSHYINRQTLPFESKYRLCFTSDISESSEEEQELGEANCLRPRDLVDYISSSHCVDARQKIDGTPSTYSFLNNQTKISTPTANELFLLEDERCSENPAHSESSLSDSVTVKEVSSPRCSMNSSSPIKTPTHGSPQRKSCTQYQLDHSNTPLHSMTGHELRSLVKVLKVKMKDTSKELITLLIDRDGLVLENKLLHQNIAKLKHSKSVQ